MHAACLVAEYRSSDKAQIALEVLRKSDFHADAISVVWGGHESALQKVNRNQDDDDSMGVETSMGIGAVIAALVGTPLAISTLMGPVMIAGPIVALVGGASLGGVIKGASQTSSEKTSRTSVGGASQTGLFARANQWGIHHSAGEHYEECLRDGCILIIVTSTPPRLDEAQAALKTTAPDTLDRFALHNTWLL